jgi:hypothetical protein
MGGAVCHTNGRVVWSIVVVRPCFQRPPDIFPPLLNCTPETCISVQPQVPMRLFVDLAPVAQVVRLTQSAWIIL